MLLFIALFIFWTHFRKYCWSFYINGRMFLCQWFVTSFWTLLINFSKGIYVFKLKICSFWSWLFLFFFLLRILRFLFTLNLLNFLRKIDFSFDRGFLMTFLCGIGLIMIRILRVCWIFNPWLTDSWWSDKFIGLLIELRFFIVDFFLFDLTIKFEFFSIGIEPIVIRVI